MPDYKKMYTRLFNSQTDAIKLLQDAQLATEEMYVEAKDPQIVVLPTKKQGDDGETDA